MCQAQSEQDTNYFFKLLVICFILAVCLLGNTVLLHTLNHKVRSCSRQLLRSLITFSLVYGFTTTVTYGITIGAGYWPFGDSLCQLYGVISLVLTGGWIWLLAIAALERYTHIISPADYSALFSSINTTIMVLGSNILLLIIFIGPTYGWGEYSFRRGELPVLFHITNGTVDNQFVQYEMLQQHFIGFLSSQMYEQQSAHLVQNVTSFLSQERNLHVRGVQFIHQGLLFSIRATYRQDVECLWEEYINGTLEEHITEYLNPSTLLPELAVQNVSFGIYMEDSFYDHYRHAHLVYQAFSTCGLDYTGVNTNVHSFIGFFIALVLVLPFLCMVFFFLRTCYSLCCTTQTLDPEEASDDIRLFAVYVLTACVTYILLIPYFTINIIAGRGKELPGEVHFFANLLHFSVSFVLSCMWLLVSKVELILSLIKTCFCMDLCKANGSRKVMRKSSHSHSSPCDSSDLHDKMYGMIPSETELSIL